MSRRRTIPAADMLPLSGVPFPGAWAELGACRKANLAPFFPERGEDARVAKAVCRTCTVRAECLEFAIPHADLSGVWGGVSAQQRKQMRAERATDEAADRELAS